MLQAATIALVLAGLFHDAAAATAPKTWPFVLGGYAMLAATVPWLAGGIERNELSLRASAIFGVVGALPFAGAAWALHDTPYRLLACGFAALVGLSAIHALSAVVLSLRGRSRRTDVN